MNNITRNRPLPSSAPSRLFFYRELLRLATQHANGTGDTEDHLQPAVAAPVVSAWVRSILDLVYLHAPLQQGGKEAWRHLLVAQDQTAGVVGSGDDGANQGA
jgi:hypothetical protein